LKTEKRIAMDKKEYIRPEMKTLKPENPLCDNFKVINSVGDQEQFSRSNQFYEEDENPVESDIWERD
jgi:hypothetical protein